MSDQQLKRQNELLEDINWRQSVTSEDEMQAEAMTFIGMVLLSPFILAWHLGDWAVDKIKDKYRKNR